MSRLKIIINILSLILVLSQGNYPIIPNPGYDTITIIPVFGTENNISEIPKTHMENTIKIMTNNSLSVNTSDIDAKCTLECYTGCRILFPEYIEQKFCISNFCRCQIIEKNLSESNNNIINNSSSIETIHSDLNKFGVTQYLEISKKFKMEKNDNNFYLIFYLCIFIFSFGYEFIVLKYFENINEFSFKNWLFKKNDIDYKKYRLTKENEFDIINENNNELRRCLI